MPGFRKAEKRQAKLRMALVGPAGSGKTYSALSIASHLGERIAVIDTEHGSASKYADIFTFDVMELETFHPQRYIDGITYAEMAGYDVLIIDSLSHAWAGKDGVLELVDRAAKSNRSNSSGQGNSFGAWRDITPIQNALIDRILGAKLHVIATMRTKTEYVQEKDERNRTVVRKVGTQPVQRSESEYEFDVVGDLDQDNTLIVTKTRCPALTGAVIPKPGQQVADTLTAWLQGAPEPEAKPKVDPNIKADFQQARDEYKQIAGKAWELPADARTWGNAEVEHETKRILEAIDVLASVPDESETEEQAA
jgi:hypothetical protein